MATTTIGKTKRSTDELINEAIDRQQSWLEKRRKLTRAFLKRFNFFSKKKEEPKAEKKTASVAVKAEETTDKNRNVLRAYWFPMTCAVIVIILAIIVMFTRGCCSNQTVISAVPEPVVKTSFRNNPNKHYTPSFDLVRIDEKAGNIMIAGRNAPMSNVSIIINKKVVATEHANQNGEFVYLQKEPFAPGNYVISLVDANTNVKSKDSVFVYISERGYKNSVSLLMTENGSRVLQAPKLIDGDLVVSKIDYLDTGRIVVTGRAIPRLRVSLSLNGEKLGVARVSDYRNFGLGADVGELKPGKNYELQVRLHDATGRTVASVKHSFVMPAMTGDDNTFYTVRRGDCLWIIARNFLRRGVLFTMIAERNNIENPDLIFPNQLLQIPLKK